MVVAGVLTGIAVSHHPGTGKPPPGDGTATATATHGTAPATAQAVQTGTATLLASLAAPGGSSLNGAFFSVDGNYIAAEGAKTGAVYVFSAETLKPVATLTVAGRQLAPVSFSSDDTALFAADRASSEVYELNIATGRQVHAFPLPAGLSLDWTYGSGVVDAIGPGGVLSEYTLATGTLYARVPNPGPASVMSVRSSATGQYLVLSDENGAAYLINARTGRTAAQFRYPAGPNSGTPEISRDGNTVYVPGGSSGAGRLWSRTAGRYVTPADSRWPDPDGGVSFSVDGKFVLTSAAVASEVVDTWNIAAGAHDLTLTVPGGADEEVLSLGPGASELLSTGGLNAGTGVFSKLDVWSIPA